MFNPNLNGLILLHTIHGYLSEEKSQPCVLNEKLFFPFMVRGAAISPWQNLSADDEKIISQSNLD
jgi:hypothetical protein